MDVLGEIIESVLIFSGVLTVLRLSMRMSLFLGTACRSIPDVCHLLSNDSE